MKKTAFSDSEIDKIIYRFIDSSVPPQYHRSYSIEVRADQVRLIVDSYGDVLLDQSFKSNQEIFNRALSAFHGAKISTGEAKENPGCTGGKSEKVQLLAGSRTLFSAYSYNCQGSWGDLRGNSKQFASEMKALVPDLGSILRDLD